MIFSGERIRGDPDCGLCEAKFAAPATLPGIVAAMPPIMRSRRTKKYALGAKRIKK
jgi:hypothetical protein